MGSTGQKSIILLIQGGAGDVLAATPMIRGFRVKYPDDEIAVIATHAHLLERNPNIDRLISFNIEREVRDIYNHYGSHPENVRFFKHFFPYDAFLDTPREGASSLSEFLCNLYGVPFDGGKLDYVITKYEQDAAHAFMKQFLKPVVLLHLTGVLPMKSVDFSIVRPLVEKFSDKFEFVQIGGTDDASFRVQVPNEDGSARELIHDARGMPMRDTISIMPLAKTSILIESIFAHCSNALDLSSVVIFQSTNPDFFGYPTNFNVWDSGGCEEWPCDRPIGPLNKFLPAYKNLQTGDPLPWMCPDPKCSKLKTEDLEKVFLEAVNQKKGGSAPTLEEARDL